MSADALKAKVEQQLEIGELWKYGEWRTNYVEFRGKGTIFLNGTFHLEELRAIVRALEQEREEGQPL